MSRTFQIMAFTGRIATEFSDSRDEKPTRSENPLESDPSFLVSKGELDPPIAWDDPAS
jgi:hypothetical protein